MVQQANRQMERRAYTGRLERRQVGEGEEPSRVLEGHAAVFDTLSHEIWGFREKIDPGAFKRTIGEDDIVGLFQHNPSMILGRNTAGTMTLKEDRDGLVFEIDVAKTSTGDDVLELVDRGDINAMSFSFRARKERWEVGEAEGELDTRTLEDVQLSDISPVTFPAYPDTDVDVAKRSRDAWHEETRATGGAVEDARRRERLEEALG